jgi:hypothetical protein
MLWALEGESLLPIDMESKNSMVDVAQNKAAIDYCTRPLSVIVSCLITVNTPAHLALETEGRHCGTGGLTSRVCCMRNRL